MMIQSPGSQPSSVGGQAWCSEISLSLGSQPCREGGQAWCRELNFVNQILFFLTTFGPPVFLPWGGKKYTVRVGVGTLVDNQEWISTRASLPHLGRANLVANV